MKQLPAVDGPGRRESPSRNAMPRVNVRVDLFSVSDDRQFVALQLRSGCQRLPRRDLAFNESPDASATRIMEDQVGAAERYQEQLCAISHGKGDWTVTVTYLALGLAEIAGSHANATAQFSSCAPAELSLVDRMMTDDALRRLRAKLGSTAIAVHFLPPSFALSELQTAYEAMIDRESDKRNVRRGIHAAGLLEGTGESRREGSHGLARLYRKRTVYDAEPYLTPARAAHPEREAANR